jgi:hypothetical protein
MQRRRIQRGALDAEVTLDFLLRAEQALATEGDVDQWLVGPSKRRRLWERFTPSRPYDLKYPFDNTCLCLDCVVKRLILTLAAEGTVQLGVVTARCDEVLQLDERPVAV